MDKLKALEIYSEYENECKHNYYMEVYDTLLDKDGIALIPDSNPNKVRIYIPMYGKHEIFNMSKKNFLKDETIIPIRIIDKYNETYKWLLK